VYTVIDFDGRFNATRRRGSVLGSRTKDRNITEMFATQQQQSRRARSRNIVTLIARRAVITQQRRSKHRHLNGEKGGDYDSFKNRMKLHATTPLQREEGQRLEATTTKRCSSAGECRNAIPNCGRHRQPTSEQHARTASWMRTDQAKGSNKGTSESSKRMITLHTRVLPERALIYTQ
jgi:hypothetical protein